MRFDLPLTAFALESAGAAARALGVCHTLTLQAPATHHAAGASQLELQSKPEAQADAHRIGIRRDEPQTLTITF